MPDLLHELIIHSAKEFPQTEALVHKGDTLDYATLHAHITDFASTLIDIDLAKSERIAIYLPKCFETVIAFFGISMAGGVFVPVNPILKAAQVAHIVHDSNARILITSSSRLNTLKDEMAHCHDLHTIILTDDVPEEVQLDSIKVMNWKTLNIAEHTKIKSLPINNIIDADMAAILYTSGSTGKPKGVVLTHKNMVAGAKSVASYLENTNKDRLLAILPFSFDYGFSQLSTAFLKGACVVLMEYLLPRDIIKMIKKEKITGLAAVPPVWIQLSKLNWPKGTADTLRYITNSGGAMPVPTLNALRKMLPRTRPYLMYGLTEAFRSTYLPPDEIDSRPESMGKAIPNAEILVVREDGSLCAPGEPGELVHRGSLVALGYWNDPEKTAERFKPAPGQEAGITNPEIAVWSGDTVKTDDEGYLYFIGRKDEMIKTSGYRVSPTEVEEVIYQSGHINEAVAIGIPHPDMGQAILLIISVDKSDKFDNDVLLNYCKKKLPGFMVPAKILEIDQLPRNQNGKIDRKQLTEQHVNIFTGSA